MKPFVLHNIFCVDKDNTLRPTRVACENGTIVARDDNCPNAWQHIDGNGLLALPGCIDPHTHFDDPGYTTREDFAHGSRGAIAGGVTTVCDMPDTSVPPVINPKSLENKIKAITPHAYCDFALWGGISRQAFSQINWRDTALALHKKGVMGFKIYTLSGMHSFTHLMYEECDQVFAFAGKNNILIGVHAEDAGLITALTAKYAPEGTAQAYAASRPIEAETRAVTHIAQSALTHNAAVHIVHLSSRKGADIISNYKNKGCNISAETCPHYLSFTVDDMIQRGSVLKCAPPIKTANDKNKLWAHLLSTISFLATDHAPCTDAEKNTGNFFTDYAGMPGVELLLPFLFTYGYHTQKVSLKDICKLLSENAAKRYNLYPHKGHLMPGADADIVLIDPDKEWIVRGKELQSKGNITPFEGEKFKGKVIRTWLRGSCVYNDGSFFQPSGRFITP